MTCLNAKFNDEISFALYADANTLKRLFCVWSGLKDIYLGTSNCNSSWQIHSLFHERESTYIDKEEKCIRHYHRNKYLFIENHSLIKEFIVKTSLTQGYIWLHGSSFSINGKNIIVLGSKGAGKTTWLMTALHLCGALFICNDQIPVYLKNNYKLVTYKWRMDIKVSPETLEFLRIYSGKEKCDRYLLFPEKRQLMAFDIEGLSKLTNSIILPLYNYFVPCAKNYEHTIDAVICLDKSFEGFKLLSKADIHKFWNHYYKDNEVITPLKYSRWNKEIPYWNKRITNLPLSPVAIQLGKKILCTAMDELPFYGSNNRLPVDRIKEILTRI